MSNNPRAPLPGPSYWEARRKAKEEEGIIQPAPPPRVVPEYARPPLRLKIVGRCIVAGKKHGDTVELPDNGATRALIEAGHLVVVEPKGQAAKSADQVKEADNG